MKFINHYDQTEWGCRTAAQIASVLGCALRSRGKAVMIAAGGSTPVGVYAKLGMADLEWNRITIMPSDERWVEETSMRSNIAKIKASLRARQNPKVEKTKFISLYRSGISNEAAAPLAASRLKALLPADLCILGMGEDMHTASLFPQALGLRTALSADAPLVMPARMPETGEERVTLTLPALMSARRIFVLIRGVKKKAALHAALRSGDSRSSPILPFLADATVHYAD